VILVDTSVWIDFLEGKGTLQHRALRRLLKSDVGVCLTGIVVTEILQGIRDERQYTKTRDELSAFPILDAKGLATYVHAADIYRECARKGMTVRKTIDCLIAAIAIEHDVTLFHKDRDFSAIKACCVLKTLSAPRD
jgi:predicted nucleic acid-binding protein